MSGGIAESTGGLAADPDRSRRLCQYREASRQKRETHHEAFHQCLLLRVTTNAAPQAGRQVDEGEKKENKDTRRPTAYLARAGHGPGPAGESTRTANRTILWSCFRRTRHFFARPRGTIVLGAQQGSCHGRRVRELGFCALDSLAVFW